jgi:hypothetical protein
MGSEPEHSAIFNAKRARFLTRKSVFLAVSAGPFPQSYADRDIKSSLAQYRFPRSDQHRTHGNSRPRAGFQLAMSLRIAGLFLLLCLGVLLVAAAMNYAAVYRSLTDDDVRLRLAVGLRRA